MKTFKQFMTEAKDPLRHTESGKLINHISKAYDGEKKMNDSTKGANRTFHSVGLSDSSKKKLGSDLKKSGWTYSAHKNSHGELVHTYKHPHDEHTAITHVDHDPNGPNRHLSNRVSASSHKDQGKPRITYD